ncbi:MAG: methyltransferase domain-containing protein [Oscillospiraceae bacterium]|nr:methyltransferase domain-containing protein [Oscillospiraceae bacterium]
MADWNSAQYLKFKAQRTQPASDLAARIDINPLEIIDIGCGPGNSTRVVKDRFPNARAIGADSSENMLETARRDNPDCEFIQLDAGGDLSEFSGKFDLVFSNACIQWIPNHSALLPNLFYMLKSGGALAVQIPVNFDEPIHKIIGKITMSEKWRAHFPNPRIFYTLTEGEYFDILSDLTSDFEMWKTIYFHRMPSYDSIIEWYKSTGLKPYLDVLSDAEKEEFINDVRAEVEKAYPTQKNGEIIFRFPRLFFIAKRS